MKAEEDLNTEVDEKPLPILFLVKESEKKVSFVSVSPLGQFTGHSHSLC
jgi:hypothetical protein